MVYLLVLMLVQIVFLLLKGRKSPQGLSFAILLCSYLVLIMAVFLFMAKNDYYTTKVLHFPSFPLPLWRWLFFLDISKNMVVRIFNFASILVVFCSLRFTNIILRSSYDKLLKHLKKPIIIYLILQLIIYDPVVQKVVYYAVYPDIMSRPTYNMIVNILEFSTTFINLALILSSAIFIGLHYIRSAKIRMLQFHSRFLSVCYALLCVLYCSYFYITPSYFLELSKVANTVRYRPIPLFAGDEFYITFPILLLLITMLLTFNIYRVTKISRTIQSHNYSVSRQISASETTSKLFCHYIKNEVLALQTQLELIPVDDTARVSIGEAISRCEHLYNRIDSIHHTTKTNVLQLKEENIQSFLIQLMQQFDSDFQDYQVEIDMPESSILALIDQNHMNDAIHNIIRNSIDAMEPLPPQRKHLTVKLQQIDSWVVITVTDKGNGIPPERLHDIFTPFYTTSTYKKHWGIGLTLTYKIIKAHDGEIEVDSTVGEGTTTRILLPSLQSAAVINLFDKGVFNALSNY